MKVFRIILIVVSLSFMNCTDNNDLGPQVVFLNTLDVYLEDATFETGAVIACAGNTGGGNSVRTIFYPAPGMTNFRLFASDASNDPNDHSEYEITEAINFGLFNGALNAFDNILSSEKWFIVTAELNDEIKLSDPIRVKHITKPTTLIQDLNINFFDSLTPTFQWSDSADTEDVIYFEVVSDIDDNMLSGTYTQDPTFVYYDTSNVVLNITQGTPTQLTAGNQYIVSVMGISADNWINVFITESFIP
ncbi:MAG: hypothetical protein HRT68_04980 [Flavobacteriaceae bacterium]|nr:hypothetical protein [Flavobacteriaceae bacterium]